MGNSYETDYIPTHSIHSSLLSKMSAGRVLKAPPIQSYF
jgi:hypothetical protein